MFRNFLITALRNLTRKKVFTLINVGGLMLGLGCSLVLFSYIHYQNGFNKYNSNYDRVYRVVTHMTYQDNEYKTQTVPHPIGKAIREELGIEEASRVYYFDDAQINVKSVNGLKKYDEDGVAFGDSEIFKILDLRWLAGEPTINEPNTVVISEFLAQKYFNTKDYYSVVNRIITLDNQHDLRVTGIYQDIPEQSDFPFSMIANYDSQEGVNDYYGEGKMWGRLNGGTSAMLMLPKNADVLRYQNMINEMYQKYAEVENSNVLLQPLSEVHYDYNFGSYIGFIFPRQVSFTLMIIAFLLIVASSINFINLSTANATNRSREVGIRKVLGSYRIQLIFQHLTETFLIVLFSIVGALAVAELLYKYISPIVDADLSLLILSKRWLGLVLIAYLIGVTLFTGLYPAFIISSFKPIRALRSSLNSVRQKGKLSLRRLLVITQFVITMGLIIGVIVSVKQNNYLMNKDMGFEREGIISLMLPEIDQKKTGFLKNEILRFPEVQMVSAHLGSPVARTNNTNTLVRKDENDKEYTFSVNFKNIDEDYFQLFDIKLLAGKGIREGDPGNIVVVNESFLSKMGIKDPADAIGLTIESKYNQSYKIKGVVEDFHSNSLHNEKMPVAFSYDANYFYELGIKLSGTSENQISTLFDKLNKTWENVYPQYLMKYDFVDDLVERQYEAEKRAEKLLRLFAFLAIVIGSLGLYGLVDFMANKRTKEIGIRKVLGANVFQILKIFLKEISLAILLSLLIAGPLMYFLLGRYLEIYAYRISLSWEIFLLAFLAVIVISIITTGYRTFKASNLNPVETLKDE